MSKEEFLQELREALAGDVPETVIRDNVSYYGSYLSQEMAKGRTVDEIVAEIGEPFILAKTIIEHSEASGETIGEDNYGSYRETYSESRSQNQSYGSGQNERPFSNMHYIDLNKWYWKLLAVIILFFVVTLVFNIVGGIFALLLRFAGPLMMVFLLYWFIKNLKR
ncbi:MAG: hypothetical protein IJ374_12350 [Lachnospiraceae bacterium]|nr:hypothetical protein [Lachnospiraceae bacterium]